MKRGQAFEDKVNLYLTSNSSLEDVTFDLSPQEIETARTAAKLVKKIYGEEDLRSNRSSKHMTRLATSTTTLAPILLI